MTAYYNEIDPYAAAWLRNLIDAGHIAPGIVDERSIEDVRPSDLAGFRQCHFFAGVGVWSLALRRAGWPDDRPVWTGSCPCQPFSAAGKGAGFDDERHLWPAFFHLIEQCRPASVIGEQVASKDADPWIDLVCADLEAVGYAFGAVPFPSAGVGAPHIRDRLYWVADADHAGLEGRGGVHERAIERAAGSRRVARRLAHTDGGHASTERKQRGWQQRQQPQDGGTVRLGHADIERCEGLGLRLRPGRSHEGSTEVAGRSEVGGLADAQLQQRPGSAAGGHVPGGREQEPAAAAGLRGDSGPGPANGFWRAADWLGCTDGKWRPVEPGTFPLAHGAAARVGRLRAYGNAVNAVQAQEFIEAVMEAA